MKTAEKMVIAAFFIALAAPVFAQVAESSTDLKIALAKYDPFPVEAGTTTTIYFDVLNRGANAANDVTIVMNQTYPFTLPNSDPTRTIPVIPSSDSRRIEYNLLVDKNAKNGTYPVDVRIVRQGLELKSTFNVTVRETSSFNRADVVPLFVGTTPQAYPGGSTTLTVDIANVDKGTASYVIARAVSDAAEIERNEIFVGTLEPNDFISVDFDMKIKNVEPGTYPVNITAFYKDQNSNEVEQSGIIYMNVVSAQQAKSSQSTATPIWAYIVYIIGIVIIVKFIALPLWKRYRKK